MKKTLLSGADKCFCRCEDEPSDLMKNEKIKKWMQENIILFFGSKQSNAILEEKTSSNFAKNEN